MDAPAAHYLLLRQQRREIRRRLQRHGMGLVCHMPTFVLTADLTPSIRQASLAEVLNSLETAAELEAAKIVLHPSTISGLGHLVPARARAYARESLDAILTRSGQLGQCICIENMFPRLGYMVEPAEFEPLFETYPGLKFTLDIGHAFIGADNLSRILDFIGRFAERLHHIHVSDNHGDRDAHLPLGAGAIAYPQVVRALRRGGYDETATLEVFSANREDVAASRMALERLFGGPPPH